MDQMKLIISWYKLIAQAFKHQDLENVLSKGSSCTILKIRAFFFIFLILEEKKNWVFLKKSLGSSMVLVQRNSFFKWLKGPMPLVQTLSHLIFFFFSFCCCCFFYYYYFFGKIWESFFCVWNFLKYIHEQSTSNTTWIFRIQRNIETWHKQTNFKLNHDVANQMWSEAKLGHLFLLGPFRMLEIGYAWTLIMMKWLGLVLGRLEPWLWSFGICLKWLGLTLGRHASCELLVFDVDHTYTPLMGSSVWL